LKGRTIATSQIRRRTTNEIHINKRKKLAVDIITLVVDQRNSMEWISVQDQLPEEDGVYISFDGIRVCFAWMGEDRFDMTANYDTFVTHWMPLPEPPKDNQ
jgi:hypothetical protein